MAREKSRIEALGAAVLLVAYDEPSLLEAKMLHDFELPFPLLLDRTRETYAAWGLGRVGLTGAMLSPSLNWRYLKLLANGERFLGFAPDMFQAGGDFVIDKSGTMAFAHRMKDNGDRASTATLLDEISRAAGPRDRPSAGDGPRHSRMRIPVMVIARPGIVIADSADRDHAVGAKRR